MKCMFAAVALAVLLVGVNSTNSSPKVQVYSKLPGKFGSGNTLICHVSGFHPPDISIVLLKDGDTIVNAKQTDLSFVKTWQFHLTKSVPFTPKENEQYSCKVTHLGKSHTYAWEPKM